MVIRGFSNDRMLPVSASYPNSAVSGMVDVALSVTAGNRETRERSICLGYDKVCSLS